MIEVLVVVSGKEALYKFAQLSPIYSLLLLTLFDVTRIYAPFKASLRMAQDNTHSSSFVKEHFHKIKI